MLLNRANAHPANPAPSSSTGARRQSFAGTSSRSPILIRPPAGLGSPTHPPGWQPPASRSVSATFVPQVVRGTIDRDPSGSVASAASPARSPTRVRRPTSVVLGSPRRVPSAAPSTPAALAAVATSFPQPPYLRESAMRHLIQSDASPAPLPNRQRLDALNIGSSAPPLAASSLRSIRDTSVGRDSESDDEDSQPASKPVHRPPPLTHLPPEQMLPLPTRWSESDRCPALTVSPDGRDLTFHGPTGTADDAASARTNHPIPPACGIYYYEVDILNRGRLGHISIGFSRKTVKLTRLPGWETESWGYHGDDGRTFADQRSGTVYGPTFTTGDRIGCGIDFAQGNAFFTKNGRFIGYVFADLEGGPGREIYPSVGLRSTEEAVRANFGHELFQFDILSHVQQQRQATWTQIQQTLPTPEWGTMGRAVEDGVAERTRMNALILGYLAHHGYAGAARAFRAQCGAVVPMDVPDDAHSRQRIYNAVLKGDLDCAIEDTQAHYPDVLAREKGIMHFRLRCRKLGEMISAAGEALLRQRVREGRKMDEVAQGVLLTAEEEDEDDLYEREDSMDVDDEGPQTNGTTNGNGSRTNGYALKGTGSAEESGETQQQRALEYGKLLGTDCMADGRPEVRELYARTSVLWSYTDPQALAEYASQTARAELANELNQAILESQGKPTQPALERLYRHTEACVMTLGALGVGAAAYADMKREFVEN
ncbi:SPRY-domain-containing protein [Auricularia subglabra TFB-10046 SS5]|nr:SPRY-domain-containing protein [Auricularia subglabra TFB-10046 SS5]